MGLCTVGLLAGVGCTPKGSADVEPTPPEPWVWLDVNVASGLEGTALVLDPKLDEEPSLDMLFQTSEELPEEWQWGRFYDKYRPT